jgi:hypothetical protein
MAPTIQVPAARTFNILENILKKRTDANRILKEREKRMLSVKDYQRMEVGLDNKPFLQPLDSENTKANIYYTRQKFMKYARKTWISVILIRLS